jgi:multidrug transporter EmrE-like cation transporter
MQGMDEEQSMLRARIPSEVAARPATSLIVMAVLVGLSVIFNIVASSGFKLSAASTNWRGFLGWQVVGNLAGLVTVLALTGLLRLTSLHVAYPVTTGLSVVGVQVVAAALVFREAISPAQWLGTLLVVAGIVLITSR